MAKIIIKIINMKAIVVSIITYSLFSEPIALANGSGNGDVTQKDIDNKAKEIFNKYDKSDEVYGLLSFTEFTTLANEKFSIEPDEYNKVFDQADIDADDQLIFEEFN